MRKFVSVYDHNTFVIVVDGNKVLCYDSAVENDVLEPLPLLSVEEVAEALAENLIKEIK